MVTARLGDAARAGEKPYRRGLDPSINGGPAHRNGWCRVGTHIASPNRTMAEAGQAIGYEVLEGAFQGELRLCRGASERPLWSLGAGDGGTTITIGADAACDWQIGGLGVPSVALCVLFTGASFHVRRAVAGVLPPNAECGPTVL